jgi:hypothetical protein
MLVSLAEIPTFDAHARVEEKAAIENGALLISERRPTPPAGAR